MDKRAKLGKKGEDIVAKKLKSEGFSILHRNYRKRFGEIDIIAVKKDLLIFVEVKMRKNPLFDLSYLIVPSKQKKNHIGCKRIYRCQKRRTWCSGSQ